MGDNPKYIIVESMGLPCAIVFDPLLDHKFVAGERKVISAGRCSFGDYTDGSKVQAYGESKTLGIKSRKSDDPYEDDSSILARSLHLNK